MPELQYMPFYVGDYDKKTAHLTIEEDGVYNRLLRLCWQSPGCTVPDNKAWLIRHLRVDEACWERACVPVIEEFFQRKDGRLFQKRQLQEYAYVRELVAARKSAGSKGGTAKSRKFKGIEPSKATELPLANDQQTAAIALPPTPTLTPTFKEEEGAGASPDFQEDKSEISEAPPSPSAPTPTAPQDPTPAIPPGLLDDLRQAVGVQTHDAGPYWSDPTLRGYVAAWLALGLTPDRIVAEAKASRTKNPDPPDGPKALERWMQTAARAIPDQAKPQAQRAQVKPPASPEDRLNFFADWVNGDKPLPPSAVTTSMAQALIHAGLVTVGRMRERGIAA